MQGKAFVGASILSLAMLTAGVLPVAGQDFIHVTVRYAVKFVCGDPGPQGTPDVELPLTRGRYHTAINVHNPALDSDVEFVKKVAVASASPYEGGQRPGKVTPFVRAGLKANEAFEIDCPEIAKVTELPIGGGNYIKGFVVILSPQELDVVAVYTGRGQGNSPLSTIHVLPVLGREQIAEVPVPAPERK
jgi:hypothetical protein